MTCMISLCYRINRNRYHNNNNITSVLCELHSSCGCWLRGDGGGGVMCHPSHRRVINVRCFVFPTRRPTPAAASPLPLFNRNVSHSRNKPSYRSYCNTYTCTHTHALAYVCRYNLHTSYRRVRSSRRRRSFVHAFSRHSIGSASAKFDFLQFV